MYRNVVYSLSKKPDSKIWESKIILFTWDEQGNPTTVEYAYQPYLYYPHPDGEYKGFDGQKLKLERFENIFESKKWKTQHPNVRLYDNFMPERQFLLDTFQGQQENDDFTKFPLRYQVQDIEVAIEDETPQELLEKFNRPMNVVTIYDSKYKKYFCWVLLDKKWPCNENFISNDQVEYRVFQKEELFLIDMIKWQQANYADIITGWNVDFDICFSIRRIQKVLGDDWVNKLSPVNNVREVTKRRRIGGINEEYQSYEIKGISIIDYLFLYRDKYLNKQYSFKLGHVGQEELKLPKIEYNCSFKEFYRKYFFKFVEYNIRDVEIVVKLEEKFKYLFLSRKICNMGLVGYECINKSSPYILGAIALEARKNGVHLYTGASTKEDIEDKDYEGAFVFDPIPSICRGGIASFDLNSLYPNAVINNNISPETKVGKVLERKPESIIFKLGEKQYEVTYKIFYEIVKDRLIVSGYDIIYLSPLRKKGIIPSFCERLYAGRKRSKKKASDIKHQLNGMDKKDPKYHSLEDEQERYSGMEKAYKTFLNSIYGQLGSRMFPLYDVDNASSVTRSGQTIIKGSIEFINKFISDKLGLDHIAEFVAYGDTDSNYVDFSALFRKMLLMQENENIQWTDDNIKKVCEFLDGEFIQKLNENCCKITKEKFFSPLKNIEFKREVLCSEAIFFTKKKYILHVINDEGMKPKPEKAWKYVGVDIKKNELPPKIKNSLEYVVKESLTKHWKNIDYVQYLKTVWKEFIKLTPVELGYMKNYKSAKEAVSFLQMETGTTIFAKSSQYYNDIIDNLKLNNKYDKIVVGDRIRYLYIKPNNIYGISVMGWREEGEWPKEFDDIFEIDYEEMFDRMMLKPLSRLAELNKWDEHPPYQNNYYSTLDEE